ncbi:maleylpyruvate isomerase family mycothiol-dependent enzyme [Streptomyces alboniger]|uniref:Maleylpyruvate isomerase family mycothiol-dependent enzyme n=1 Tax=Streptomyces alboniger TaxID=132473 RepID=A0A5J6HPC6_STRAD|nr:maleylpyruvate isomerase family mycothiol-dependent enzyme [Streptomyces alboniger]QEV21338.1 maleylpyruvate isomerase family mycothiol-dependent enzyme [Streptomyces alboniger]
MRKTTGNERHVRAEIAAERRELASLFDGLSPAQWDAPSLCAGWRVREVVAHMSLGFRRSLPMTLLDIVKAGGSLHRMTDRRARADAAAYPPARLAAYIRDNAHHPWTPPVGGYTSALAHDVVHGLDVTVALGLDRAVPAERLRIPLGAVDTKSLRFFGADLTGVALHADDLDWSYGSGIPVRGAAQDLLLVAFGRKVPPGRLRGEGCERYLLR